MKDSPSKSSSLSNRDVESMLWTTVSLLSRRDYRTQPGVLTPGAGQKAARPEGAVGSAPQISTAITNWAVDQNCLPPLQGGSFLGLVPGVKTPG